VEGEYSRSSFDTMKIVVLDGHTLNPGDNPWTDLAALGSLTVYDRTREHLVEERARDAVVVLTNKTPLAAETLGGLPHLRFVCVLATGYNIVDVAAAARLGIVVSNVPEYGTDSVAQHVFALLLELCQRVAARNTAVKSGGWAASPDFCFWDTPPIELAGLTMGIVGFGRIGQRVGQLASAFGMRVLVHTRTRRIDPPYAPFAWADLADLVEASDVISFHCPLTAENEKLVDDNFLGGAKPGAFLINTARGALIDEPSLARALASGRLAGAALDVVSEEPIRPDNPLLDAPNCILTPHIAWASLAARRRLMAATVANLEAFLAGNPIHVVS
jgi:glycerate dehydrogenase